MFRTILMILLTFSLTFAGTTGKISGTVMDASTGEGLIGCNVVVVGTNYGASVDMDGHFIILGLSPGEYIVKASMIGYQATQISEVYVRSDLTTNIDFKLSTVIIESGGVVEVVAKRAVVTKDLTSTSSIVSAEAISAMPVTEMSEIIDLQAGMVDGHMRGGRSGEVAYWIDGIPVNDVYDGGQLVEVSKDLVQELQVMSGAFNAEYGQAMSGIVNITTKSGYSKWGGSLTLYSGDYLSSHNDIYFGIEDFNPMTIKNAEISLHGPLVKNKVDISLTHRNVYWQGWQNGQHRYNPSNVPVVVNWGDSLELYSLGENTLTDSIIAFSTLDIPAQGDLSNSEYASLVEQLFLTRYESIHNNHLNGLGDSSIVPMQWNRKQYTHARLNWSILPQVKLGIQGSYTDFQWQDYDRAYRLNPLGILTKHTESKNYLARLTHTLSSKSFYSIGFSNASKRYDEYNADDYIVYSELSSNQFDSYSFLTGGSNNSRFERQSITNLLKLDYTSQINNANLMKFGIEGRQHNLTLTNKTLQPPSNKTTIDLLIDNPNILNPQIFPVSTTYTSKYEHNPVEYSGYIQDKLELTELIINIGVRWDYFDPDGVVLADPSDPSIYAPLKVQNIYEDVDNNGVFGNDGDTLRSLESRQSYWFKDASPKSQFSPRFGASFPITDKGVIHVSYGYFLQIPRFELLYQNPDFDLGSGTGNIGVVGNADLEPEKTISGEIGLKQELIDGLTIDITGYFRDIRNLVGTNSEQIEIFGGSAHYNKIENSDFAYIKGLVLALNYWTPSGINAGIDYTFQVSEGTASDPEESRNAIAGGAEPGVYIRPLNWDQRHTVNLSGSFTKDNWGASLVANFGSGLPYTPNLSQENTLLTNGATKPFTFNTDLNSYYNFKGMGFQHQVFLRVQNLFDHLNQTNVYDKTGSADFTPDQQQAENLKLDEFVNTVDAWFLNETFYSEPRRIEIGWIISL